MRKIINIFIVLLNCICILSINAQEISLFQTHKNGIYKTGEKARIVFCLPELKGDSINLKIQKNFTEQTSKKMFYLGDSLLLFEAVLLEPTTLVFEVISKMGSASIGLICDSHKFKPGTQRPKDFNLFWNFKKNELKALPLKIKSVPIAINDVGFECFDTELNCTSSNPARGYFAKPKNALAASLPIVVCFHAAGVKGDWCRSEPGNSLRYAKMGKGALSFDLNAHGMLNGQPNDYYNNLDSTILKNYAQTGLENKETVYFLGMYLRLLRTIDYLTSQPEWDGKRILVLGESQGGGQALAAAGLDKRITAVVATVPAMCDWGGTLVGRKGSWPYPFLTKNNLEKMLESLPYYDVAHILKGSKATLVVEIGLIDQTCPSSAIFAALNLAKGKKQIITVPYRGHHMTQPAFKELFDKTVTKPKDDFIQNYLK